VEFRIIRPDGVWRWIEHTCQPIFDEAGRFQGTRGSNRDITERRRAEEEIRKLNAELEQRVLERTEQLAQTVQSLQAEIAERRRAEEELRKLGRAVEQSPVSIVITDTTGHIEYVNPRFTAVTGYTFEEAIGNNPRILKSGDKSPEEYRQLWETISAGREWRGEFHNKKKNGELYWESASISPITNGDGRITHFVAVKEDITERKRAADQLAASLREKEVLLREIHHRVKNNLQVISSLLNLQADGISDQRTLDIIHDSQTRVEAIALVHEKLYRSPDLARIDLNDYLQDLTAGLFSAYQASAKEIALHVNIPDVSFNLETAIPLGLVVTELLSNCLKHAFPPARAGTTAQPTIHISVGLPPADADDCYMLSIRDNGVGLSQEIDMRHMETLGLQLVTTLVEQLAGQLESHSNGGTEFRITFREIQYKERN
jgi:PAS domain S-box-containing protein